MVFWPCVNTSSMPILYRYGNWNCSSPWLQKCQHQTVQDQWQAQCLQPNQTYFSDIFQDVNDFLHFYKPMTSLEMADETSRESVTILIGWKWGPPVPYFGTWYLACRGPQEGSSMIGNYLCVDTSLQSPRGPSEGVIPDRELSVCWHSPSEPRKWPACCHQTTT